MARERDLRLDVLKAAAIALVVFGHIIRLVYRDATAAPLPLAAAFSVLALLDVPLFVFVSGYLAPDRVDLRWLGRRALQLLVPFFAWTLLRWLAFYRTDPLGALYRAAVWLDATGAVWFLYALFAVCALYWLAHRNRTVLVVSAVVAAAVAPSLPFFSLRYIAFLFPVFVAGRFIGAARFEPGAWIHAVTAGMLALMWAGPGENLIFAAPWWLPGAAVSPGRFGLVGALVAVARIGLALSLILSAMHLARGARRGAWLGSLTLGVYCFHTFVMPGWARGGGIPELAAAYLVTMFAAVGGTIVMGRWETPAFLLLGSARPPAWMRRLISS